MLPVIQTWWSASRIARCALVGAVWIGANVVALTGYHCYESWQLEQEFGVRASVIRQYQSRSVPIATSGPQQEVSLWYRFRPPSYWARRHGVPLLIFLHGSGQRGSDNVQQLRSAPSVMCDASLSDSYPCAVLAPQCPQGFSWSSRIDSETDMRDVLLQMIDNVLQNPRIDPQRVYLAGSSMGGFGVWELAAHAPDRFAAVVPIAGGGDTNLAKHLIDVPLWAVHGADDQVVPPAQSRTLIAAIKHAGGDPQFSELPGVGHGSWPAIFKNDSEILDWMFKQRQAPPTLSGSMR